MAVRYFLFGIIVIMIVLWIAYGNRTLEIQKIHIASDYLPKEFDGFKIAQISDLHNKEFGCHNQKLISILKQTEADSIVITGDVIDSRRTNVEVALSFAKQAVKIAPTYYVNGNHEARIPKEYERLKKGFTETGVIVLENSSVDVIAGEKAISLVGISDLKFHEKPLVDTTKAIFNQLLRAIPENENYKILLAHRPEYITEYAGKVHLVFSGHAHGGQFILPFAGGLFAPGQGLFPKYYDGLYEHRKTSMVVSRGIGNSIFPFRINNRSVIVVAELKTLGKQVPA